MSDSTKTAIKALIKEGNQHLKEGEYRAAVSATTGYWNWMKTTARSGIIGVWPFLRREDMPMLWNPLR